jgi:8-oxo-dGTP pyrophosphatase MutT (NUDIX family)
MLPVVRQAAVLATHDGRLCLVSSSSGRRWVIPKGQIDPGHTAGEAALIEAWEEAGLVGTLDPVPAGTYVYEKLGSDCHVLVFRMTVTEVRDQWPERVLRERVWVTADEAIRRVDEPGLRDILRRLPGGNQPAPHFTRSRTVAERG